MKRNTRSGTITPLSSVALSVYRIRGGAGCLLHPNRSTIVTFISILRLHCSIVIPPISTTHPRPSNIVSLPIAQINHQQLAVADSNLTVAGQGHFTLSSVDTEEVL